MSAGRPQRRRGFALLAAAASLLALLIAMLVGVDSGVSQPRTGEVTVQPDIGVPASAIKPFGAATQGGAGEVWGFGSASLAPATVEGQQLSKSSAFVILRHADSEGWRVAQAVLDESGQPLANFAPAASSRAAAGRVTAKGGGVLLGRVGSAPALLRRNPGERFLKLPDPDAATLLPGEALVNSDRFALSAADEGSRTGVFVGPQAGSGGGVSAFDGVLHWDGLAWTREPIDVPASTQGSFEILAVAATSTSNAWLLAQPSTSSGRGVMLFKRESVAGQPHWVEQSLGGSAFADRDPTDPAVSSLQPVEPPGEPLTATADGVWVDGNLRASGEDRSFTLFFDSGDGKVTGTWCDVPGFCGRGFGARFSSGGYRSFAWSGSGFGTRVITKPLKPGGEEATNRGTYLAFDGDSFQRMPGIGGGDADSRAAAFSAADEGWLGGSKDVAHVTRNPAPSQLERWPVAARRPLTAVAGQPGKDPGAIDAQAVAVGADGGVARYTPGQGWAPEFLLNSAGLRAVPRLRGVAWPEAGRAYAVGDLGEMWVWQSTTGLWERDEARPLDLQANLMDVEFQQGSDSRGYAVGRKGTLLRYGKSWTQEPLPSEMASYDLMQVAFAGSQALVAARGPSGKSALLVNDGSGWRVDQQAQALIDSTGGGSLLAVGGLPDGGAVAAGYNVAIERDSGGALWRFADQPIGGRIAVAAAATRPAGQVRAVLSVVDQNKTYPSFPPSSEIVIPGQPPPLILPSGLPQEGFLLREGDRGWIDEQHAAFRAAPGRDAAVRADAVLALLLGKNGRGWAVGGETGEEAAELVGDSARRRTQTSGIFRYPAGDALAPGATSQWPALATSIARFAVGGHAVCEEPCADFANLDLGPDRGLELALRRAAELHRLPGGPRAFAYSGGRLADSVGPFDGQEAERFADVARASAELPFYSAVSQGESSDAAVAAYRSAFSAFPTPFGGGSGAATHFAFDTQGSGGRVRVVVIDNSSGSLAASDPHQFPAEAQEAWLRSTLQDAKGNGIATIVVGSRDLSSAASPSSNLATDADRIAKLLVENGASAYFFDRPEENRMYPIPAFAPTTIPSFGSGTLGYRNLIQNGSGVNFNENGFLLAEVNAGARDAGTNRAPVGVRLIPVIDELALEAVDGLLLRRSRPALFTGLGRRAQEGQRNPVLVQQTEDPYVSLPPEPCVGSASCLQRIDPDYEFVSSKPDIGDFVRRDPSSSNLRDVLLGAGDKPISDAHSGLFCAFNAGTTTVTVRGGGLAYSQRVTVQAGSVRRPCGTRPLSNPPTKVSGSPSPVSPPPAPAPAPSSAPPLPAPPPAITPVKSVKAHPFDPLVPVPPDVLPLLVPPIPAYVVPRPPPPGTLAGARYEEKREEEPAYEDLNSSSSRYEPEPRSQFPGSYLIGIAMLAAFAGAAILRPRRRVAPAYVRHRR